MCVCVRVLNHTLVLIQRKDMKQHNLIREKMQPLECNVWSFVNFRHFCCMTWHA